MILFLFFFNAIIADLNKKKYKKICTYRANQTFDALDLALMVPTITDVKFALEDFKKSVDSSFDKLEGMVPEINCDNKMICIPYTYHNELGPSSEAISGPTF